MRYALPVIALALLVLLTPVLLLTSIVVVLRWALVDALAWYDRGRPAARSLPPEGEEEEPRCCALDPLDVPPAVDLRTFRRPAGAPRILHRAPETPLSEGESRELAASWGLR